MTITFKETKAEIDKVVAAVGVDHKAVCFYRDESTSEPMCIVGHLVNNLFGEDALMDLPNGMDVGSMQEHFEELGFDRKSIDFLDTVQSLQDAQVPWGEAVSRASKGR